MGILCNTHTHTHTPARVIYDNFRKIVLTFLLSVLLLPLAGRTARGAVWPADTVYTFRFVAGDDMFYIPWNGNGEELERLEAVVARLRARILVGEVRLRVDGYCASGKDEAACLALAKVRSNRVKSELMTRQGVTEACFVTRNHAGGGDRVTVRVAVPPVRTGTEAKVQEEAAREREAAGRAERERRERERLAAERERQAAERARADSAAAVPSGEEGMAGKAEGEQAPGRGAWYAGVQAGMPFGVSAMSSFGDERTTPGWSAGVFGGYRFGPVMSVELQAAWGQLFLNRRGCCPDYWTGADGRRYEGAVAGMEGWYASALQSRAFVQRYGVQVNVNLLGWFAGTRDGRWAFGLSPHAVAAGTRADFRLAGDKRIVVEGDTRWHFGAGGHLQAGYAPGGGFRVGLYTGLTWYAGDPMDGTAGHLHESNYVWETGLRFGWNFGIKGKEDRP